MRFYQIVISDPNASNWVMVPNYSGAPGYTRVPPGMGVWTYCSLNAGATITTLGGTNMAAQQFEIDAPVTSLASPVGNPWIRIWGVSLAEMRQAKALNGLNIVVYGGMAKGLPLANPAQVGPLVTGTVLQAFGNWTGNAVYIDLYVAAAGASPSSNQTTGNPSTGTTQPLPVSNAHPANIVFQWPQGSPLLPALVTTLSTAFPQYTIKGSVNPGLVWSKSTATGFSLTLKEFAEYIEQVSLSVISGYAPNLQNYPGVQISFQNNTITITDQSTQTAVKPVVFTDLIGQCSWNEPFTVQATCVLRGDIFVGDSVHLPPGPVVTTFGSSSQYNPTPHGGPNNANNKEINGLAGVYWVGAIRHVGDSRSQDAQGWSTTLDCHPLPGNTPVATGAAGLPVLYKGQTS